MSEPPPKAQDPSPPPVEHVILLVGPPSFRPVFQGGFEYGSNVWTAESLEEADRLLARQGYRVAVVFASLELPADVETWRTQRRSSYPWISFKPVDAKDPAAMDASGALADLMPDPTGPQPPYQAGEVRFLREAGPLLISLCQTERPWDLEAEGVVLPVGRPPEVFGGLAHAWESAIASTVSGTLRSFVDAALERRGVQPEQPVDAGVFTFHSAVGERQCQLLLATGESSSNVANASIAVDSSRASIELAASVPGLRTLVLPLVGTGDGALDPKTVLNGLLEEYDPKTELGDLRHVIVTVFDESDFENLLQPVTPTISRGQRVENDIPSGPDRLGIQSEVEAIADAISLKEMSPPIVVGILGGWGSGKSFALHLMRERLRKLRTWDLSDPAVREDFPFVGHTYLVHFDAWTYAKSNLWASLMHAILTQLDEQLSLERTIGEAGAGTPKDALHLAGIDIWHILDSVSANDLELLRSELGPQVFANLEDWTGGRVSQSLWSALEATRAGARQRLEESKQALDSVTGEYEDRIRAKKLERDQARIDASRAVQSAVHARRALLDRGISEQESRVRALEARVRSEVDAANEGEASVQAWSPVLARLKIMFGDQVARRWEELSRADGRQPPSVAEVTSEVGRLEKLKEGATPANIAFLVAGIAAPVAAFTVDGLADWLQSSLPAAGAVSFVASGFAMVVKVRERLEAEQADYEKRLESERTKRAAQHASELQARMSAEVDPARAQLEALRTQRDDALESLRVERERVAAEARSGLERELARLEQQRDSKLRMLREVVTENERIAGLTGRGKSLDELIRERLASGDYGNELGVVHRVQEDLREISDALHPSNANRAELFPRGRPRIVLVIDDLDRCPPDKVVQVLEAAQLLVKTPLFVVVLATDVRYVTRSLEKQYKGILVTDGIPSGLDYIEKIVQIPYRVPDIDPAQMRSFLGQQMTFVEEQRQHGTGQPSTQHGGALGDQGHPVFRSSKTVDDVAADEAPMPTSVQHFKLEELEVLNKCCKAAEVSPRTGKRLVNVFKLLKIIWHHRGVHREPTLQVKQGMLLLLALSARYPVVMREVLRDLDGLLREEPPSDDELTDILIARIQRMSTEDNEQVVDRLVVTLGSKTLMPAGLTLTEMRHENLRLVRSFSFVGETTDEFDPKPEEVEVPASTADLPAPTGGPGASEVPATGAPEGSSA